ncbi:MAG: hypothetical protein IID37_10170 [Planctomycetes bacterium]|nr:hypothetical protein [Planctomycetota bacterium]
MESSVGLVEGVSKVAVDLNSGWTSVEFESAKSAASADLWEAVKESGFTPVWVKIGDQVYNGPNR